jgi:uncharacterized protein YqhQ
VVGFKALNFSAEVAVAEEEAGKAKSEKDKAKKAKAEISKPGQSGPEEPETASAPAPGEPSAASPAAAPGDEAALADAEASQAIETAESNEPTGQSSLEEGSGNVPDPSKASADGQSLKKKTKDSASFGPLEMAITLGVGISLALVLFVALPHVLSMFVGRAAGFDERGLVFHLVDGLLKFGIFILYIWGIGRLPEIGRLYAYHGAEHKAIHAYEAKLPLTPESAAPFPAWHPRCGTAFIFFVLALSVLFFAAIFPLLFRFDSLGRLQAALAGVGVKIVLMLPLSALAYELTRLAGRHDQSRFFAAMVWPGLLLQKLTTREPDSSQLEVALHSLESVLAGSKSGPQAAPSPAPGAAPQAAKSPKSGGLR